MNHIACLHVLHTKYNFGFIELITLKVLITLYVILNLQYEVTKLQNVT